MANENIKQVMQDAVLDADSLEKFINGSDSETVLTRLSAKYPTLQKAIKQMFENGGLPATPFKTEALMTASSLGDGKYAMVTDDVDGRNGMYIKSGGVWSKSSFDLSSSAQKALIGLLSAITPNLTTPVNYKTINGQFVNSGYPSGFNGVLNPTEQGSASIRIAVSDISHFYVKNSVVNDSFGWPWVFTDAKFKFVGRSYVSGEGLVSVPNGAVNADRTIKKGDKKESNNFEVVVFNDILEASVDKLSADVTNIGTEIPLDLVGITDAAINMTEDLKIPILAKGAARRSIKIDIDNTLSRLVVYNTESAPSVWDWVFVLSDGSRKIALNSAKAHIVDIPKGAVKAYKTIVVLGETTLDISVSGVPNVLYAHKQVGSIEAGYRKLSTALVNELNGSYFSDNAVFNVNDFEGESQTEQIKSAVRFAKLGGGGVVEISRDTRRNSSTWIVNEAILLPSDIWVYINNVTVKKANGLHDNVFRNDGVVPHSSPYEYAVEMNENSNIRIFGNDKYLSRIEGNRDNPPRGINPTTGKEEAFIGDSWGWRSFCVYFVNTKNYRVHNLSFAKATHWTCSNEHGCRNFKYHDLHFDNRNTVNSDGVDIRLGCSDFEVFNITGHTMDDMVAINTMVVPGRTHPVSKYYYPSLIGGFEDAGHGTSIKNGRVWNIRPDGSNACVLLLAVGGGKLENISVSDIKDKDNHAKFYLVEVLGSLYGTPAQAGDIKNITIYDIESNNTPNAVWLRGLMTDSWINKVTQNNTQGYTAINSDDVTYNHDNLEITNIKSVV